MRRTVAKKSVVPSSTDNDSDVEKNFHLIKRGKWVNRGEAGARTSKETFRLIEHDRNDDDDEEADKEDSDTDGAVDVASNDENSQESSEEVLEEDNSLCEDNKEINTNTADRGCPTVHTRDKIQKELSFMSFEDKMKLQNKVGTKVFNEIAYGRHKTQSSSKKKRLNKNRPMEISSKMPVPLLRSDIPVKKTTLRDPRFDDLSGEYKPEIFERTYKFIRDIQSREKELIQKQLKRTTNNKKRQDRLQFLLKRMEDQERVRKNQKQTRERELEFKQQQRQLAKQGLQPFHLKKSEKKKLQLADKYKDLQKSGKLHNFISKKRKRNALKDRRKLPV